MCSWWFKKLAGGYGPPAAEASPKLIRMSRSGSQMAPGRTETPGPFDNAPCFTPPRHTVLVRVTHWITTLSFLALLVSGIAILLAHPRLYWGETGAVGGPSLIDLPLPFLLTGQSGWGRSLHFLSAWVLVVSGLRLRCSRGFDPAFPQAVAAVRGGSYLALALGALMDHLRLRPTQGKRKPITSSSGSRTWRWCSCCFR